jgi:hypothetical protein
MYFFLYREIPLPGDIYLCAGEERSGEFLASPYGWWRKFVKNAAFE